MKKKYKIILLKDLPDLKAGAEVLNITQDELDGKENYNLSDYYVRELHNIFNLRNNPEWTRVEEDNRCDCKTKDYINIRNEVIGYGKSLIIGLDFEDKEIYTWYDYACDRGTKRCFPIKFCPLCGERLKDKENKDDKGNNVL